MRWPSCLERARRLVVWDNLPPLGQWQRLLFERPELQYLPILNCAAELLDRAASERPDAVALRSLEGDRSYGRLLAAVNPICRVLTENLGILQCPGLLTRTSPPVRAGCIWPGSRCEIVGYAMGERMKPELTGKALFRAVQQHRPPAGIIHHSDRGSQYCAEEYQDLLKQFQFRVSMSRKGNCFDNAPMESFWGSLKTEMVHHRNFSTRAEAESAIREYIEVFYNRQRRHSRLGYQSPVVFAKALS